MIVIELAETINNLNLLIDELDLENFVHIDDESNDEYAAALIEDIKKLLDTMSIDVADLDDDYINLPEKIIDSQVSINFHRFESLYEKILNIKYQLFCFAIQIEAQDSFDVVRSFFDFCIKNKKLNILLVECLHISP